MATTIPIDINVEHSFGRKPDRAVDRVRRTEVLGYRGKYRHRRRSQLVALHVEHHQAAETGRHGGKGDLEPTNRGHE